MSNTFTQWGESYKAQRAVVSDTVLPTMKHYALQGDQVSLHFRENVEALREDIAKREAALAQKKEKLFANAKDTSQWELAAPVDDV